MSSGPATSIFLPSETIAIYAPNINNFYYCGYDSNGNLFANGIRSTNTFGFAELPYNGSNNTMNAIALNQSFSAPGGVQWDGKHIAIGDPPNAVIYELSISGGSGTKVGTTLLNGAPHINQFWIKGGKSDRARQRQQ